MTTEIGDLIQTRLAEIKDEAGRLERAIEALGQRAPRRSRSGPGLRSSRSKSTRRPGKRAGRGERQRPLIETIEMTPAAGAPESGKAIGVSSTQVQSMIRSLESKGRIKPQAEGFVVVD